MKDLSEGQMSREKEILRSEPAGEYTKKIRHSITGGMPNVSGKLTNFSGESVLKMCDEIDRLEKENKELQEELDWWGNLTRNGNIGTKEVPSLHDYIVQLQVELKAKNKALQSIVDICFTRESKCFEMPCPCKELAEQVLKEGDK